MVLKKTFHKISTQTNLDATDSLRGYLKKKVYSKSGEVVGSIKDIYIKKNNFQGILVKTSSRSTVYIGKEYIKELTPVTMMLSIDPVTALLGKYVFDADGKKLGIVTELTRKTDANDYQGFYVRKRVLAKPTYIKKGEVEVAKKNIILSTTH